MSHTPGPWTIHKRSATSVVGSKGFVVAACGGCSTNAVNPDDLHAELTANARLIAAAPDLLEALEELMQLCIEDGWTAEGHWNAKARAAILKARDE